MIPENVKSIDDLAFNYCTNLKNVVCCSSTAPEAFYKNEYENVFAGTNETYLRIYVPDGSAESYKAQKAWNQFSVVEYSPDEQIGEMMEYIHITIDGRQATPGMKGLQIVVDENGNAHKVVR